MLVRKAKPTNTIAGSTAMPSSRNGSTFLRALRRSPKTLRNPSRIVARTAAPRPSRGPSWGL